MNALSTVARVYERLALPLLVAAILGLFVLTATPAAATPEPEERGSICADGLAIVRQLRDRHHERPVGRGLNNVGHLVQVWVSPAGTWTLLALTPTGIGCIIGAGKAWETVEPLGQATGLRQ